MCSRRVEPLATRASSRELLMMQVDSVHAGECGMCVHVYMHVLCPWAPSICPAQGGSYCFQTPPPTS